MKLPIRSEPFDGHHLPPMALHGQHQTGEHRLAVENHRTGAALTQFAPMFGSGVAQVLPQNFQQGLVRGEETSTSSPFSLIRM